MAKKYGILGTIDQYEEVTLKPDGTPIDDAFVTANTPEYKKSKDGKYQRKIEAIQTVKGVSKLAGFAGVAGKTLHVVDKARAIDHVFEWAATGTANNGTVYAAQGSGVWVMQFGGSVSTLWFGCNPDGIELTDVNMANGSAVITSASALFKSTDIGKVIIIRGGGTTNGNISATITSYQSPTQVTCNRAATVALTNVTAWFGTNNVTPLRASFNCGYDVNLVKGSGFYLTSALLPVYHSISGDGEIRCYSTSTLDVRAGNIALKGISVQCFPLEGSVAPYAVNVQNYDNLSIENCTIINGRIQHLNNALAKRKGFKLLNSTLSIDFTATEHDVAQNDGVNVTGIDGVEIKNNTMAFTNVHRCFKFTDSTAHSGNSVSAYNTRNVDFSYNNIIASTDSGKQLMDCYKGTEKMDFYKNTIYATGFRTVIENKTGEQQNYSLDFKLYDNFISTDDQAFSFQGSVGNTTLAGEESGFQNILIQNNDITTSQPDANNTFVVNARFCHYVEVSGNNRFRHSTGKSEICMIQMASNKKSVVVGNVMHEGIIRIEKAEFNQSGISFNTKFEDAIVQNNKLYKASGGKYRYAPISVKELTVSDSTAVITDNIITVALSGVADELPQSYISLDSCTLNTVDIDLNKGRGVVSSSIHNTATLTANRSRYNSWDS